MSKSPLVSPPCRATPVPSRPTYLLPPIYTALPNSRWLHHTALRYVQRAQRGAYTWWKGLNSITTSSKGVNTLVLASQMVRDHFKKNAFLTHFWSQNDPPPRHFGILHGRKRVTTGSKWAPTTCLSIYNGPGSLLEKRVFDPFSTRFWSQNGPFSRHFGIFCGPKHATLCSKRPKNTCLSILSGLGTTLEKIIFSAPRTPVDPPLAPAVRGPGCPPAVYMYIYIDIYIYIYIDIYKYIDIYIHI